MMIPQDKQEAVTRGLREAFGVAEYDDITQITKGQTSSLVFKIFVRGTPYLLKIITRADNPTRHYTCMKIAAEAGLAPRVWYTDISDKISITDFVNARPLPSSEALVRLPALLRKLHSLPGFDKAPYNTSCTFLLNKGPALEGFLQRFRASNILPQPQAEEFFARYDELAAAYPSDDTKMVSSHNDLFKPDNILFDGETVLLVDWEAAFQNDRYADLAVIANQITTNQEDERAYLQEYFGAAPAPYQQARFHLMQQLTHIFYTMAFLSLASPHRTIDWSANVPGFVDYNQRMWAGQVNLSDKDEQITYGRVHLERLLENVHRPRYRDALRIVAQASTS